MTTTNSDDTGERKTTSGERASLIARRAYERWQARGCPEGDDCRDWFEAEQEVLAEPSPARLARPKPTEASRSRNRVTP